MKPILVVGGGIAGIEAALNLAEYGFQVYLVEDSPSIGGIMARLDKTFPTNDCSICIEAPKMYEVLRNSRIKLLTYHEIEEVKKKPDGFLVKLRKKPRFVSEDECSGCGKCIEACPVSVPDELDGKIGGIRKLIFKPFPQAIPNMPVIDPRCRYGEMRDAGACVGTCVIDCVVCRECPIAKCIAACREEGRAAIKLWDRERKVKLEVASIVVATGFSPLEPPAGTYGYGVYPDVLTLLQYERMLNSSGPTGGHIVKLSDGSRPKRVAWIQCVGREKRIGVPYCSKICCMIATKQAIITKEHDPEIEPYIFYINLRTYSKGFYEFRKRAEQLGVKYVRGRPAVVYRRNHSRGLIVRYENVDKGSIEELEVDLVVLSTAFVANSKNKALAEAIGLELDEHGFIKERDPLRAPLETTVEGVFVCGAAAGPADISESVSQAIAASVKAAEYAKRIQASNLR